MRHAIDSLDSMRRMWRATVADRMLEMWRNAADLRGEIQRIAALALMCQSNPHAATRVMRPMPRRSSNHEERALADREWIDQRIVATGVNVP